MYLGVLYMSTIDIHRYNREKRVEFAIGMAAIDGGKPSDFTQSLLNDFTDGRITADQLRQKVLEKYTKGNR